MTMDLQEFFEFGKYISFDTINELFDYFFSSIPIRIFTSGRPFHIDFFFSYFLL
jgi:hypothetical protein